MQYKDRGKQDPSVNSLPLCDVVSELVKMATIDMSTCIQHVRLRHRVLWSDESDRVKYLFICLWETLDYHTQSLPSPEVDQLLPILQNPDNFYTRDQQRSWLLQAGLM